MQVDLSRFDNSWYSPGRGRAVCVIWYLVNVLFFRNPLNVSSGLKVFLLRLFGARVGAGAVIKPAINIKYPWNLEIGDHSWIGEGAWLDSLGLIRIGRNCCISQGAYLCTGNHDWRDPSFGLIVEPIEIEDGAWIGARAVVLPGTHFAAHSVLAAGSSFAGKAEAYRIYRGQPAEVVGERVLDEEGQRIGSESE